MRIITATSLICLSFITYCSCAAAASESQCSRPRVTFDLMVNGSLCINSSFAETPLGSAVASETECSLLCERRPRCQAFSTATGPCKLFAFDRCSKRVRNCSCSASGRLFVRRQSGLQSGALCPSDYDVRRCGVRYKLFPDPVNWWQGKQTCGDQSGLVIMADVEDADEMSFISLQFSDKSQWLGGYQTPGSLEPAGGWHWVSCNLSVDASLWASDEPNNANPEAGGESAICRFSGSPKFADFAESSTASTICECVSPFD